MVPLGIPTWDATALFTILWNTRTILERTLTQIETSNNTRENSREGTFLTFDIGRKLGRAVGWCHCTFYNFVETLLGQERTLKQY